jgi:hypothetical protein
VPAALFYFRRASNFAAASVSFADTVRRNDAVSRSVSGATSSSSLGPFRYGKKFLDCFDRTEKASA